MKHMMWRSLTVTTSAVLVGTMMTLAPAAHADASDDVTINLVITNDFHGQIDENLVQWAATVQELKSEAPAANTLFIGVGDNVGKSAPASAAQDDDPTLDVLNMLGMDVSAVGNHEFDKGYSDLTDHIAQRANFPILGANVTTTDGQPALPASAMFTVGGLRVAVIGAVTDTTPDLTPPDGIQGLHFGDPVAAVNTEADRLNSLPANEKPQVILAAIHEGAPWGTWTLEQGIEDRPEFAHMVNDLSPSIAAILTGHTHNTYTYDAPIPGDPDHTRPVIQAGYYGIDLGQITLSVNPQTGTVDSYTQRDVARVTTPDAELIASDPLLAQIAQLRDDAVAYADARSEAAAEAQTDYDNAKASAQDAYAAAQTAKANYDAAVAAAQEAYAPAQDLKAQYDGAVSTAQSAFTHAAGIKSDYDAAIADGKAAYSTATTILNKYNAAIADGQAAYSKAATIKSQYDAKMASSQTNQAKANDLKSKYLAGLNSGMSSADLASLGAQYTDAINAATADYNAAMALGPSYQQAVGDGNTAYALAASYGPSYQQAMADGNAAYALAASYGPTYQQAIADGNTAYAQASAIKPQYDLAAATLQAALDTVNQLKAVLDSAVATLNAALDLVENLADKLLGLLF